MRTKSGSSAGRTQSSAETSLSTSTAMRGRVIDLFHERLYPGGVLLLGHSESLLNVSTDT